MQVLDWRRLLPLLALVLPVGGCNDTRDLAPASPDAPWRTSVNEPGAAPDTVPADDHAASLTSGAVPKRYDLPRDPALPWPDDQPAIDPAHAYSLVELIDIAQRSNKETRVAWEQARQAAIGVGMSRAAYLPDITVDALGGYQRSVTPLPTFLDKSGYFTSTTTGIFPALTMSYLLLDFGGRAAEVLTAKQVSYAANVSFTAVHQQLILDVSRAYLELGAADAQTSAAAQSLKNAQLLLDSADQKLHRGEGTVTDVDMARSSVAQGHYAVAQTASTRSAAMYSLLSAMGSPPETKLHVAFPSNQIAPHQAGATLQHLMRTALERRPDLLADLAKLRASEAQVTAARSALFPRLLLSAKGSGKYGDISTDNLPSTSIRGKELGIYLDFSWTLYQGGSLRNSIRMAQSAAAEAADTLQLAQEQAMRQVALNYDELTAGIVQYEAALQLRSASQTAFDSAADAYRHGVGTLTDASNAETALGNAVSTVATVHAQVLETAAALAFATGQLASAQDVQVIASQSNPP